MTNDTALFANNMRIAAVSLTAYEFILTIPAEYRFYRAFYRNNFRLNASLVLFVIIRYNNLLMTILGSYAFYSHSYTPESCRRLYLLPTFFRVPMTMASQAILGLRTYTISCRNRTVGLVLLSTYFFTTAVEWFAQIYHRVPVYTHGTCGVATLQPTLFLSSWLFYLAGMVFDFLTVVISMAYLSRYHASSSFTSRLVRMMIYDGLGYFVVLTVANIINVILLRTSNTLLQVSAAPLCGFVTWMMSQRILINLRGLLFFPYEESKTSDGLRKSDASDGRVHTVTPPYVPERHSIRTGTVSASARDRSSSEDPHQIDYQEGTEQVHMRVDHSVIVGVGTWKAEEGEGDEHRTKPEVKWHQGFV